MTETPKYRTYTGVLRGRSSMHTPATENLQHSVTLIRIARQEKRRYTDSGSPLSSDDELKLECLWKASILFAIMAVEAEFVLAVRHYITTERLNHRESRETKLLNDRIIKKTEKQFPIREMMRKWSEELLGHNVISFDARDFKDYCDLVEYRNTVLHSIMRKSQLLRNWTSDIGATKAVGVCLRMMIALANAYNHDPAGWGGWFSHICAPVLEK